jgi:hypothetical protein
MYDSIIIRITGNIPTSFIGITDMKSEYDRKNTYLIFNIQGHLFTDRHKISVVHREHGMRRTVMTSENAIYIKKRR